MFILYWLIAFLSGAGVLVVELAATRALNPWFGQSTFVWTNVIGLILLGITVGNVFGGVIADRTRSPRLLGWMLLVAAALVGASGWLPAPVAEFLLPSDLPLEDAYPFLLKGSFLAAFICFFPPVMLLGAVQPFLIRCAARDVNEVGARSGALYGASTLGSIVGTFATTYLLIPELGTRGTLLAAGGTLALAALLLFVAAREWRAVLAAGTVAVVAIAVASMPAVEAAVAGAAMGRLVSSRESRYQHIEVRERDDLPVAARVLALDEGLDSYQSVAPHEGTLTGGLYYDVFTMLALARPDGATKRILVLGMGAGTHVRQLLEVFASRTDLSIVGVELDPMVVEVATASLGLTKDPRLTIVTDIDARPFVERCGRRFDFVIVDCYARQSFLPPHVVSIEFFRALRERLEPGGEVAVNVFGYGACDPVVEHVTQTLARVFPEGVVVASVPNSANFVLYADRDARAVLPSRWASESWPSMLRGLSAAMGVRGTAWYAEIDGDAEPLRDDDGLLDRLQWQRLSDHAERLRRSVR